LIPQFPAYIFDVDGTLVDSAEDICGAIQGVLVDTERPDVPFEVLRGYIGRHLNDLFIDLFPHHSPEQREAMVERYRTLYPLRNHASTRAYEHVPEMLAALPGRKATGTTKGTPTTRKVLEMFGLLPYFDHVQGTDGFPAKPEPDVIYRALAGLEVDPADALFVGDSAADMAAAQRAGVRSCAVTYGYGKREDLEKWTPTYWIDDPRELLVRGKGQGL
jgi:phosphoglycolate phosphatase